MAKGSTFFHYLMGAADSESQEAFERIFAADGDNRDQLMDKLIQRVTQHEEKKKRQENNPTFWDKAARKLGGPLEKSPLDLEPEELNRLTQVQRDPENQIEFELPLLDSSFEGQRLTDKMLSNKCDLFRKAHEDDFDSDKNLRVDTEKGVLFYKGKKDLAKKFLENIKTKKDVIQELMAGRGGTLRPVQFTCSLEKQHLTQTRSPEELKKIVEAFVEQQSDYISGNEVTYDVKKMLLSYSGPKNLAIQLLKKLGLKENLIPEILLGHRNSKGTKQPPAGPNGAPPPGFQPEAQTPAPEPPAPPPPPGQIRMSIPLNELSVDADEANRALTGWFKDTKNTTDVKEMGKIAHLDAANENLYFTGGRDTLSSLLGAEGFNISRDRILAIINNPTKFPMPAPPVTPGAG
jgi:hypothetical protein